MLEIKFLPETSEVEIIGEFSSDVFMAYKDPAVKELNNEVKIDGFRQGNVPESVLMNKIGIDKILDKMAVLLLEKEYPKIIIEHKIKAVGRPEISITKIADNNPLGFKVKTAILPDITLPDYKKIAQKVLNKKEEIKTEDHEVDKLVESLRKSRAKKNEKNEETLPELGDEFAKTLGNFENMDALKSTIRLNLTEEKKAKTKEAKRMEILEKISESIDNIIPKYLIDLEKDKMEEEMKRNIEQMGMKWEDYLKHVKKTEDELKKDWEKEAQKRVKIGLIIEEMTEKEKIEVPNDELEKESDNMVEYYKKMGQNIDKEKAKNYLSGVMRNEKMFQILESLTDKQD